MRRFLACCLLAALVATATSVCADPRAPRPMLDYRTQTPWLPETPGVTSGALGGFLNPATASTTFKGRPELAYWFSVGDDWRGKPDDAHAAFDNWGLATSGWFAAGVNSHTFLRPGGGLGRVYDWQLGLSGGDRTSRLGLAYRWATGANEEIGREDALVLGWLLRPGRGVSLGLSHTNSVESNHHQTVFDLGLRPLGSDRLTVFGDFTLDDGENLGGGYWGAGLTIQPVTGVMLGGRVYDDPYTDQLTVGVNLGFALGDDATHLVGAFDDDHDAAYVVGRTNPPYRNLVDTVTPPWERRTVRYAPLNLENRYLTYQKYQYFDDRRVAWLDLAAYLDAVERDPAIDGLVIDLRDFTARPSLTWELRQRLQRLRDQGKEVVAITNRVDLMMYYLASVADHLVMDPEAELVMQGFAAGRSYFADMLAKLGIGFQELRYFKYKSAAEVGSRMDMSEGQREQIQRVVDVIYEEVRADIGRSRNLTPAAFDAIVDDEIALNPRVARDRGLIDQVGRRRDVIDWLRRERGAVLAGPSPRYAPHAYPEASWGEPPHIAVVYAVGGCAMDSGIRGRATGRYLEDLARDPSVKAVVLRADSPGGDPLPSDLVAAGLSRCREAGKPVIVSQGDVAASGGYWISMNGEEILTTPLTITGSIGVIGAWIYDDGAAAKLGIAYDGVRRGDHADLLRQVTVPELGIGLPHRALDAGELELARTYILEAYDDFVAAVARGRDLPEDRVRELAQGRVWMGGDAIDRGLCDRFGGLTAALDLARERAGLAPDAEVAYTEYPPRRLFNLEGLFGSSPLGRLPFHRLGLDRLAAAAPDWQTFAGPPVGHAAAPLATVDYARWYLETVGRERGRPVVALPPEDLPAGWLAPE
ncbi:MAG: S49 family peptidase [Candidatus Krumholzibacteriia bacterium]